MVRRGVWLTGSVLGIGLALVCLARSRPIAGGVAMANRDPDPPAAEEKGAALPTDDVRSHSFRLPTGVAPTLSCSAARAVVAQARTQLAYNPETVDPRAFAEAAADWLDPYGLWSVAPDTPIAAAFDHHAGELLADLESRALRDCPAARQLGSQMLAWVAELRGVFDDARAHPGVADEPQEDLSTAASAAAFEGTTVTRSA